MFSTYAQKLLILQKKVSHKNSVCEQLRFLETELSHFEDNIYELKKDVARKLLNLESYNRPSVKNVFLKLVGQMPRKISKAKQEHATAQAKYDGKLAEYEIIKAEHNKILSEYRALGNCDLDYNDLRDKCFALALDSDSIDDDTKEYIKIIPNVEKELQTLSDNNELINGVIDSAQKLLLQLDRLHTVAQTNSCHGNIGIRHAARLDKYNYIDEINPYIEIFVRQLNNLTATDADLPPLQISFSLKYDGITKMFDVFSIQILTHEIADDVVEQTENLIGDIKNTNKQLSEYLLIKQKVYERKKAYLNSILLEVLKVFQEH